MVRVPASMRECYPEVTAELINPLPPIYPARARSVPARVMAKKNRTACDLVARAMQAQAKHQEAMAAQEREIEVQNRKIHFRNAMQRFNDLASDGFLSNVPADPAAGSENSPEFWKKRRPAFDEYRAAKMLEIANDPRIKSWEEEISTLDDNEVAERNTAIGMLRLALKGKKKQLQAIWSSMLPEAADQQRESDPAFLPSKVLPWLKWKLAQELTDPPRLEAALVESSIAPPPPAPATNNKNRGGRPRKWDRLDRLIDIDPPLSDAVIAQRHNAGAGTTGEQIKADFVRRRRNELRRQAKRTGSGK